MNLDYFNYAVTVDHSLYNKFVVGICGFAKSKTEALLIREKFKKILENKRWNESGNQFLCIHKISNELRPEWEKSMVVRASTLQTDDEYRKDVIDIYGYWPVSLYTNADALYNEERPFFKKGF